MDLLQEIDDYMKETINESLGLPVSARTLQLKLRVYEDAYFRLRDQHLHLLSKFRQKDILIDRAKAEANMNAAAIKKKFVEENQRLAAECANLVSQGNKWERECSVYENESERQSLNSGYKKPGGLVCSHCNETGHSKQRCYEIIGYPDWWNFKKKSRKNIRKSMVHLSEADQVPPTSNVVHPEHFNPEDSWLWC